MQEEITQTSSAKTKHKHSEIKHLSTLNERVISKTQKTPSVSVVNKLSDLQ